MTMRELRQQDDHSDSEQDERDVACGAEAREFFWWNGCCHQVEQQRCDEEIDGGEDRPTHPAMLTQGRWVSGSGVQPSKKQYR